MTETGDYTWVRHLTRKLCLQVLAAPILAAATISLANADGDHDSHAIGLWGDLPYSAVQAAGVPALIADMNSQRLAFTVHDGDLKAGSNSLCDDALYTQALGYFNALKAPAAFTPGDNDWTDCDRASNGAFSSRERLDRERQFFFNTPFSLGQRRMLQEVQTARLCVGVSGLAALRIAAGPSVGLPTPH